jgi:hypothetical protein
VPLVLSYILCMCTMKAHDFSAEKSPVLFIF